MSTQNDAGMLGIFTELDAATVAIERLRKAGMRDMIVFSPMPRHELEHAVGTPESPIRMFTLVGALTGTATGFALPIWTSVNWPLVTGGKPIISLPPFVIIAFELTILFGALSTILGLFITARLPRLKGNVVYDPSFSVGSFGVYVVPPAGREGEARDALNESGAVELRERPEEVRIGSV